MRIAIIGSGIAGNVAARRLHDLGHAVTVFEAEDRPGGHTHTHDIVLRGRHWAVDTGFIVYNERTYPGFTALLDALGVATQPSDMSFSVRDETSGLEYNGTTLNTLFAQRRNLFSPRFLGMVRDILRFNREAVALLDHPDSALTLDEFLRDGRYGQTFVDQYLVPMGAAIWSSSPEQMRAFPAGFFVRFFHNHGMLSIEDRPQWRVVRGGSQTYLNALIAPLRDTYRLSTPIESVRRDADGVWVTPRGAGAEHFQRVFLACHADQAMALLSDADAHERTVLGAIPYQENQTILHTDTRLLPRKKLAWAAWNYHRTGKQGPATVTYNMNILQTLDTPETLCVTLNREDAIDPSKILKRLTYHHPVYTPESTWAQTRHREINGARHTYFCGAYWRFGFHEDGLQSAETAVAHFVEDSAHAQQALRRVG